MSTFLLHSKDFNDQAIADVHKLCMFHDVNQTTNCRLNPLPNDNILDWSKFKAFADNKTNVTENMKFILGRAESTVGKGENAGSQHFLLCKQCFQRPPFTRALTVRIV